MNKQVLAAVGLMVKLLNMPMRNPDIVKRCDDARFFWSEISIEQRKAEGQHFKVDLTTVRLRAEIINTKGRIRQLEPMASHA